MVTHSMMEYIKNSTWEVRMPHVVALYRYPLKGFTPEECKALTVLDTGRIAGIVCSGSGLRTRKRRMIPGAEKLACWRW